MGVIADMIFAVTEIAVAFGAVTEFQFRITHIGTAADCTPVGIGGLALLRGYFAEVIPGELDDFHFLGGNILLEEPHYLNAPGKGEHVQYIFTEEQEIVGQGDDGEKIVGERINQQTVNYQSQIHQCKDPGFNRNDEKQTFI